MVHYVGPKILFSDFIESSVEKCVEYFKDKRYIQVDTETELNTRNPDHLANPYENKVICIQLGDKNNQWVIDSNMDISPLKIIMEDRSKVKIFTNAFFDLRFFHHWNWKIVNVYDCFLVEKILNCGKDLPKGYLGLAGMVLRYCNVTLKKDVRTQIQSRGLDATVVEYAAEDVHYMEDILYQQMKLIIEMNMEACVRLENKHIISLSKISYKGFKIDINAWIEYATSNKLKLLEQNKKLNEYIVKLGWEEFINKQLDLFSDEVTSNINWNSPKQVIKLFKKLDINCQIPDKKTGMLKYSVDGKHLQRQSKKFDILPIYLKYKEIGKELSTYGVDFIKQNINPVTKRVHSEFFPILDTGRISSNNPNLQNIPAIQEDGSPNPLRQFFVPEEGNCLIICDYSGQEDRIIADKCNDPLLNNVFLEGSGDTHSLTATVISPFFFGEEIQVNKKNNPMVEHKGQRIRDIAKILNFKMAYGGSAFTLKDDLECSQEEAQKIIDLIIKKFKGKTDYFNSCHKFIKEHGYVIIDPVTGRRSWFYKYDRFKELEKMPYDRRSKVESSEYYKLKGSMERMSQNYPVQGTAASMTKTAVIMFDDYIDQQGLDAFIVNAVHDEIVVECKREQADVVMHILKLCMERAGKVFCKLIPIIAEPSKGDNWGAK